MIKKELESIGLSEKEAAVYLASLELGQSPVQKIAQHAEINRPTAYVIIESLIKKGLMSSMEQGKKTFFFAEDPENLKNYVTQQREEVDQREKTVKSLIPGLDSLFKTTGERPVVRFFEGEGGISSAMREVMKEKTKDKEILNIISYGKTVIADETLVQRRINKGIVSKNIYTFEEGEVEGANDPETLRYSKFVPNDIFGFEANIAIFGDKVLLYSHVKRPVGVLIDNKNIASTMKDVFKLAWSGAGVFGKK